MSINPSSKVRFTLYVAGVFLNASTGFLVASGVEVPVLLMAALAGYNAVIAVMAGTNVNPDME